MMPDPGINPKFGVINGSAGIFFGPWGKSHNQVFIKGFLSKSKKVYFCPIFDNFGEKNSPQVNFSYH